MKFQDQLLLSTDRHVLSTFPLFPDLAAQTFDFTPCTSKYLGYPAASSTKTTKRVAICLDDDSDCEDDEDPEPIADEIVYGHLSLGGAKKHCLMTSEFSLSVYKSCQPLSLNRRLPFPDTSFLSHLQSETGSVKTADQVLTHSVCSQVDDKSQLQNTWAMNLNTGAITFVGQKFNGTQHPTSLSISSVNHRAVKLNANEDGRTSFYLQSELRI